MLSTPSSKPIKFHIQSVIEQTPLRTQANHFLKRAKQTPAGKKDRLWVIQPNLSNASYPPIYGAVRLMPVAQHIWWLRNLYIDPAWRQQGLGSLLLQTLIQESEQQIPAQRIILFARPALHAFYQRNGLTQGKETDLPPSLRQRFQAYQQQGRLLEIWLTSTEETSQLI